MKLYLHPHTSIHLFYGDELCRTHGMSFSTTGRAQDAGLFEEGDFDALYAEKTASAEPLPPGMQILKGEPVVRRSDMNPHGLI